MIGAGLRERRAFIFASLVCLFIATRPALGQGQITVRFVDYRSGKPIKNFYLSFEAWNGKRNGAIITKDTSITREKYSKELDGKVSVRLPPRESEEKTIIFEASTKVDREGRLTIYFPETVPEHIRLSTIGDLWSQAPDLDPSDVIENGKVVPFPRGHISSPLQFSPTPGEIVILSKRVTAWDRIRQEIP